MDRWMADLGYCLPQVDTSNVLGNITRLKGELPAQTSHIMRNVSCGQGVSTTGFPSSLAFTVSPMRARLVLTMSDVERCREAGSLPTVGFSFL